MGITHLNTFINQQCPEHIQTHPLSVLKKKKIVVDVQIYIYKFLCGNGTLIQNMFMLCTLFVKYEIIPIFIFDGRKVAGATANKTNKKKQRKENRNQVLNTAMQTPEQIISETKFQFLKRQVVRVTNTQIEQIRQLIQSFGFTCITATGEADEICAHASITNKSCECVSDDTDMFAYGCTKIFRNLDLENQTITLVDVSAILNQLNMSLEELREVCSLSSNDYNCRAENIPDIFQVMEQFREFKSSVGNENRPFYEWFMEKNEFKNDQLFKSIYNIFDVFAKAVPLPNISFVNNPVNHRQVQEIMEEDGFYYL